eukprot:CAMPEP_0119318204 /NCGR_PEP_ID=MMETSP1333-20130426/45742_1 /TAXON_ID=418940 /ORGANISM="Scyphosphaera apsteinii, Strain RCC1455" /LENGTH=293 /DNA_ID=CAMNT_0007324337 /DNA_START=29 /DNA_END=910 /DNA_ORIENTATION=-
MIGVCSKANAGTSKGRPTNNGSMPLKSAKDRALGCAGNSEVKLRKSILGPHLVCAACYDAERRLKHAQDARASEEINYQLQCEMKERRSRMRRKTHLLAQLEAGALESEAWDAVEARQDKEIARLREDVQFSASTPCSPNRRSPIPSSPVLPRSGLSQSAPPSPASLRPVPSPLRAVPSSTANIQQVESQAGVKKIADGQVECERAAAKFVRDNDEVHFRESELLARLGTVKHQLEQLCKAIVAKRPQTTLRKMVKEFGYDSSGSEGSDSDSDSNVCSKDADLLRRLQTSVLV